MLNALLPYLSRKEILTDLALLVALVVAWYLPRLGDGFFGALERAGARLASRKGWAIVFLAGVVLATRIALLPWLPIPAPQIHDEFSYLLAADTFAHGRLTNPTHPMWIFFDTFHVNQQPTYMSKYPPAQGAVLALGQWLGNPWIGVLLSVAVMCAVLLWMMQGWLPPRWALLGAVLVLLRIGIFSYWMNSYWGGAVAATGGALVVGALPRIWHRRRARDAVILGLGAALLANSRPFEGLLLCLPVFAALLFWMLRQSGLSGEVALARIILPLGAVLALCGIFIAYYNWRVSGNPLVFPYAVNERTYVSTPTLFWETPRPALHYLNPQFDAFYNGWMRTEWLEGRVDSLSQALKHLFLTVAKVIYFFLWPELCVPLIALAWLVRDRRIRFLIVLTAFCLAGFLLVPWTQAHYAAPLTGALFVLLTQGIRHIRRWRSAGRPVGVGLSRAIVLASILLAPFHPHSEPLGKGPHSAMDYRARFEAQLSAVPGEHLVIVRYTPKHAVLSEWVYNRADIDRAKVVWAREIPGVDSRPLLDYFRGRQLWLAEPDVTPPRLSPYHDAP